MSLDLISLPETNKEVFQSLFELLELLQRINSGIYIHYFYNDQYYPGQIYSIFEVDQLKIQSKIPNFPFIKGLIDTTKWMLEKFILVDFKNVMLGGDSFPTNLEGFKLDLDSGRIYGFEADNLAEVEGEIVNLLNNKLRELINKINLS